MSIESKRITEKSNKAKLKELLPNTIILLILIWFVYGAYYELFISEPGVHIPRVNITKNTWDKTMVQFTMNVPTITSFVILVVGFLSSCASLVIYIIHIRNLNTKTKKFWMILITGFIICLVSMFVAVSDFLSTAFDGVG